ncbi:MAG: glycosyltransferase family 2 protein [Nitrospirota bacterium]
MKILVIIPAYNEEENIARVISQAKKNTPNVIVIDDGSTDNTVKIAGLSGAKVLSHPFNLGYGSTLLTGYKYAFEKGYDFVIQLDADGQHDPGSIKKLFAPIENNSADIAIGSRFLEQGGYHPPFLRKIGISLFSVIVSRIIRQRITDPTSGFQAINKKVIEFYNSEFFPPDYPDADVLIGLHFAGFRITEVGVKMYPKQGKKSMHSGVKSIYYLFKMFFSIFLTLIQKNQMKRGVKL